jgi:hypothetical protein
MRLFFRMMKTGTVSINTYLWVPALLALALAPGCETEKKYESKEKETAKQLTSMRLHIETTPDALGRSLEVPIFRARPTLVTIEKSCFLTEQNVKSADLVDEPGGGFSIKIEFERQGRWLLDKYSGANMKRRIVVFAAFPQERWLAAPVIKHVITDGILTFTPDATREEADRIVRGLNNVARKMDHDPRF